MTSIDSGRKDREYVETIREENKRLRKCVKTILTIVYDQCEFDADEFGVYFGIYGDDNDVMESIVKKMGVSWNGFLNIVGGTMVGHPGGVQRYKDSDVKEWLIDKILKGVTHE